MLCAADRNAARGKRVNIFVHVRFCAQKDHEIAGAAVPETAFCLRIKHLRMSAQMLTDPRCGSRRRVGPTVSGGFDRNQLNRARHPRKDHALPERLRFIIQNLAGLFGHQTGKHMVDKADDLLRAAEIVPEQDVGIIGQLRFHVRNALTHRTAEIGGVRVPEPVNALLAVADDKKIAAVTRRTAAL